MFEGTFVLKKSQKHAFSSIPPNPSIFGRMEYGGPGRMDDPSSPSIPPTKQALSEQELGGDC